MTQQPPRQAVFSAISSTPVLIAESRGGNRQSWYVRNTSADAADLLTISVGASGTAGKGYLLRPTGDGTPGEWIVGSNGEGFRVFQGEIWAISAGAAGALVVIEEFYSEGI